MLQPISQTDIRLNSILALYPKLSKHLDNCNARVKRVTFPPESIILPIHLLIAAMAKATLQEKRRTKPRPIRLTTPTASAAPEKELGSSSTWRKSEIDQLHVEIERDVNAIDMIPERFFDVENLPGYKQCNVLLILLIQKVARNFVPFRKRASKVSPPARKSRLW
jgi:hypothetical protein